MSANAIAPVSGDTGQSSKRSVMPWLSYGALALFATGVMLRVAPLFNVNGRLLQQFPTEDGYLMLTLSRNLALGKGLTVSDGLIPSNGSQPLATLLWSVVFWLVDGDRERGVLWVQICEILFSLGTAFLLGRLGERLFGREPIPRAVAWFVAATWFASPVVLPHTMNCLETALYGLTVVACALTFLRWGEKPGPWSTRQLLGMGALLGAAFWARNDAVFLGAAAGFAHFALPRGATRARRALEVAGFGAVAGLIASPWMAFNYINFGSIVPISGHSQSMMVEFGSNAALLPVVWAEYLSLIIPVPATLDAKLWVIIPCSLFVLLVGTPLVVKTQRAAGEPLQRFIALLGCYAALLTVYYGLAFGAPHFLPRYLFPIGPFLALLWGGAALWLVAHRPARWSTLLVPATVVLTLLVCFRLGTRVYALGDKHEHFQVVRWAEDNVPDSAWVAAPQTGTLGFFHDRTINLDGKVNPEALIARRDGRIPHYVVEKNIHYIADWAGMADWVKLPVLSDHFEVLVHDPDANLAVLRRKGAPSLRETASNP